MPDSPYNLDPAVANLQKQLADLEVDFAEKRGRLLSAITALTGERATTISPEVAISKDIQEARMRAVDAAIKAMPDTFTTIELRDYIANNNLPEVVNAIKGSYLPTRLTVIANNKKIKIQQKGENGQPNRWVKL